MDNGHQMLNIKYSNRKQLKNILSIYSKLEAQEYRGNTDALAIKMDIDFMLTSGNIINEKKSKCLKMYFIEGYSQQDIAKKLNMTQAGVNLCLKTSIDNIVNYWIEKGE